MSIRWTIVAPDCPARPAGSVAERDDLACRVERQRPCLPDDLEVRALLDVREKGLGALDLSDHQRVLDADDPRLLGLGQPDAIEGALHGFPVGIETEWQLCAVGGAGAQTVDGRR